jgi:PAS domain S-box-containing protein
MVGLFSPQTHSDHHLGSGELSSLLDGFSHAAFLLEERSIAAVNAKVTELTAYTRHELMGKQIEEIVAFPKVNTAINPNRRYTSPAPRVDLITRNHQKIPTYAHTTIINDIWRLITLEPMEEKGKSKPQSKGGNPALQALDNIIQILQLGDVDQAINKILGMGKELLEASTIAIYVGNSQKPGAIRIAQSGELDIFPMEIYSSDLSQLLEPTIWTRGQRSILTLLQQSARVSGLNFFTTHPIRDVESFIGILVAGGFYNPNPDTLMQTLNILCGLLATTINKNTLINNLWKNVKKNEERITILSSIKNVTSDGIVTVLPSMKLLEFNKTAELILGYGNHEIRGAEVSAIFVGTDRILPALQLAFQGTITPNLGEVSLHRRDGTQFPAEISTLPIQKHNRTIGAFIILRDKSESEQIRVRANQLEQRALLGEVTAVFAHEVRNPINNISTGLQLMADDIEISDANQDVIARMLGDCSRLTDLMESVLMFSRSGNYRLIPLSIFELINRLVSQWSSRMNRLRIEHHLNVPSEIYVEGDKRALEQVFTNLISNAIQAMENMDGGTLAIKATEEASDNGRTIIQIDVSDTGPGIPKESISRIFEPFFTTKKNGTGLGLAITKQIITAHRGSINLSTFPGGTVFHVRLPAIKILEMNL